MMDSIDWPLLVKISCTSFCMAFLATMASGLFFYRLGLNKGRTEACDRIRDNMHAVFNKAGERIAAKRKAEDDRISKLL